MVIYKVLQWAACYCICKKSLSAIFFSKWQLVTLRSDARVCTMPSATWVEWTELCQRTEAEGKLLICLTQTVHPRAFVGGVEDWFVDLFVTAIAADTLSVKPSQSSWFYYMWSNVIRPSLAHIHPKLNFRTVAEVDTCWRSSSGRACIVPGSWRPGGLGSPIWADGGPGGWQASWLRARSCQPQHHPTRAGETVAGAWQMSVFTGNEMLIMMLLPKRNPN